MSVTVSDLLKLPSLRQARVIGGAGGLKRVVSSISVLELSLIHIFPAYTNQAFFTYIHNPYRTYYCHFEITCQQTDLFELIHLPLCIDAKDPKKAEQLFLDLVHSVRQDDIFSALKAKQAVLNLLCYYPVSYTHLPPFWKQHA